MKKYFWGIKVGLLGLALGLLCSLDSPARAQSIQNISKPAGVVAWWRAEGNANDSAGGHHGILYNGATATALGQVGLAFSFDGVDDRISVPDHEAFKLTGSLSIEAWIAPTAYTGPLILFRGDNRIHLDPYALQIHPDGRIGFYIRSETEQVEVMSSARVPLNTFSHVAGTFDGATGEMRVYIDGILQGSLATDVRSLGDLDPGSRPGIGIGNHGGFPNTAYNYPFSGRIDELALYNRALTMTEIENIYNVSSGNSEDNFRLGISSPGTKPEGGPIVPGSITFKITLSRPSRRPVKVSYKTSDGTAKAGKDYKFASGALVFARGETSSFVRVYFIGDKIPEADETFYLDLGNPVNAIIANDRGIASIRNDDGPSITIDNAPAMSEGNSGTTEQTFTVALSTASTNSISVEWATAHNTAKPDDYVAASGTLTFAPGETRKTIVVEIKGDTVIEPSETYRVKLKNSAYAVIANSQAIGYILDDDGPDNDGASNITFRGETTP